MRREDDDINTCRAGVTTRHDTGEQRRRRRAWPPRLRIPGPDIRQQPTHTTHNNNKQKKKKKKKRKEETRRDGTRGERGEGGGATIDIKENG